MRRGQSLNRKPQRIADPVRERCEAYLYGKIRLPNHRAKTGENSSLNYESRALPLSYRAIFIGRFRPTKRFNSLLHSLKLEMANGALMFNAGKNLLLIFFLPAALVVSPTDASETEPATAATQETLQPIGI